VICSLPLVFRVLTISKTTDYLEPFRPAHRNHNRLSWWEAPDSLHLSLWLFAGVLDGIRNIQSSNWVTEIHALALWMVPPKGDEVTC
jgi:hypothetical protein